MPSQLFTPLRLRDIEFRNRVFISPMCQYSSHDGMPSDWHLVHLGSRAVGGAGLVMQEATAVSAEGRITPGDAGIWNDAQARAYAPIVKFIKDHGAVPGIQIAHAGRKASCARPWEGGHALDEGAGGWRPVLAPSPVPFSPKSPVPHEMTAREIAAAITQFAEAAKRGLAAGFEVVEIHSAHGYLMHEFLSPLSNKRADSYGGCLENRMRLTLEITKTVRDIWPEHLPVFVRISASDWVEGGWDIHQSVELSRRLKALGADLIDASSGGMTPDAKIPAGPGYQVPFAQAIREEAGIATGAVGFITGPAQAEQIIATGQADAVLLARESLRDPYWPLHAAHALGVDLVWPEQYRMGKPR